jgi:predicted nicotinamide N-methyase
MEDFLADVTGCYFEWSTITPKLDKQLNDIFEEQFSADPELVEFQNRILEKTLLSPIGKEFPPSSDKTRKLFKRFVLLLEASGVEVREEFYNAIAAPSDQNFQFKSYFQKGNYLLSLAERNEAIYEGTTGLTTWKAAKSLLHWLQVRPQVLQGHVLELGSGAGYTGIGLAKLGLIEGKLTLTDHHRSVLEALTKNVDLNLTYEQGWSLQKRSGDFLLDKVYVKSNSSVCVEHHDWQLFNRCSAEDLSPDVVIGADIVFDEDLLPPLVETIRLCLDVDKPCSAYIAGVVRNDKTSESFVRQLKSQNLKVEIDILDHSPFVHLYKITI